MEPRYWVIAGAIVLVLILLLAWDPDPGVTTPTAPAASARIVELGEEPTQPAIATIDLNPGTRALTPDALGAGADLIARYERERQDPTWARTAMARLTTRVEESLDGSDARIVGMDCRATACRFSVDFAQESLRSDGVAALVAHLQSAGIPVLIERAERARAEFLAAP